jgi:hypothetical protein
VAHTTQLLCAGACVLIAVVTGGQAPTPEEDSASAHVDVRS